MAAAASKSLRRSSARAKRAARPVAAAPEPSSTAPTAPGSDGLLDLPQAIDLLKTTRTTFYRWLKSGAIKGMKIGRQWRFYRTELQRFLEGAAPRIDLPAAITPFLEDLRRQIVTLWNDDCVLSKAYIDKIKALSIPDDDPKRIDLALDWVITLALVMHATDIHLSPRFNAETGQQVGSVRFQIDGNLQEAATLDARLLPNLITKIKAAAACDVNIKNWPQDGRIVLKIENATLDLRICFIGIIHGEAATLRVLQPSAISFAMERLGLSSSDRTRISHALDSRWGVVVISGPTNSGKTTTLYSCLSQIAGPTRKVMSIEDPVEYMLPWVDQMQVDPRNGLSFAVAMRAILRSAPHAILVGEIRDRETLLLCCQAALTGHLVLSTLHAPDAASALVRMVEIGVDPFVIGDATRLTMSQRLVRVLCPDCAEPGTPDPRHLEQARRWAKEGGLRWDDHEAVFMKPVGCARCMHTGYRGRVAAAETLPLSPELGAALRRGAGAPELRKIAVEQGMTTMLADGVRRALAGETTLLEVMQHAGTIL
ncbi:MAG TPA: ATPase, T2SS/T4P/T4SS family [Planctomycetota bacterium]|nr:ATPase, T2SS/T4P/T4SS family [Planctomycetota bacterium]